MFAECKKTNHVINTEVGCHTLQNMNQGHSKEDSIQRSKDKTFEERKKGQANDEEVETCRQKLGGHI